MISGAHGDDWLALTADPLSLEAAVAFAGGPAYGAVASFLGVVRDHSEAHEGIEAIEYEAYAERAPAVLDELAAAARESWPALGRIVCWHRVGLVGLGEASLAVVVSAPHREEAFAACRFLVDSVKRSLPVWKLERWADGAAWSPASSPIEPVPGGAGARP